MSAINLQVYRGKQATFNLALTQNGAALNLTGGTLRFTAKYQLADLDAAAVFTKSSPSNGIVVTNAAGGLATLTISAADTSSVPAHQQNLFYDIQFTDGSGNPQEVGDVGTLFLLPAVTLTTP